MPRLFFAVPLPEDIQESVATPVRPHLPEALYRTIPSANLHITLVFLGDVTDDDARGAERVLREPSSPSLLDGPPDETLTLSGVGAFPRRQDPRVVWVGVASGVQLLTDLRQRLVTQLTAVGLAPDDLAADKPFHPHVTVAYRRKPRDRRGRAGSRPEAARALHNLVNHLADHSWSVPLREIVLYESRLAPGGAIHTPRQVLRKTSESEG